MHGGLPPFPIHLHGVGVNKLRDGFEKLKLLKMDTKTPNGENGDHVSAVVCEVQRRSKLLKVTVGSKLH